MQRKLVSLVTVAIAAYVVITLAIQVNSVFHAVSDQIAAIVAK